MTAFITGNSKLLFHHLRCLQLVRVYNFSLSRIKAPFSLLIFSVKRVVLTDVVELSQPRRRSDCVFLIFYFSPCMYSPFVKALFLSNSSPISRSIFQIWVLWFREVVACNFRVSDLCLRCFILAFKAWDLVSRFWLASPLFLSFPALDPRYV